MNILVVGSGAREHAIVWKCIQSELVDRVFCAPGNAGIGSIAQLVDISATDIEELLDFAVGKHIDLTIVGPEAPLVDGIVDRFENKGLMILGPSQKAAQIEGSKVFCKRLLKDYGIPTADFVICPDPDFAEYVVRMFCAPCVVKADGLAAGKGVVVAHTLHEALEAVDNLSIMEAGQTLIVEEMLEGWECSFIVATDGKNVSPLALSKDYKRAYDGDKGPNTGGMGAHTLSAIDRDLYGEMLHIMQRVVLALYVEGRPYKGFLYGGFMITDDGPRVLEFNCRLGDPEAQVILPKMKSDFVEMCLVIMNDRLGEFEPQWSKEAFVDVVIASPGYPDHPEIDHRIYGLEEAEKEGAIVFHAGTKKGPLGGFFTDGGRVLSVVGRGECSTPLVPGGERQRLALKRARDMAYRAANHISFGNKDPGRGGQWYRKDIALKV